MLDVKKKIKKNETNISKLHITPTLPNLAEGKFDDDQMKIVTQSF